MAEKFLLKKDHLKPFLRKLTKAHRLVAPLRNRHGDTIFTPLTDLDHEEIDLDNQPQNSLKPFFFPQQETICNYRAEGPGDYRFSAAKLPSEPTIFFGVRPCDLSALLYLDVIFLREVKDPSYQRRREESVLIGLNCTRPFANCFCNSTKNGPHQEFGFDLQLTDLGDHFLVEVGRAKGGELLEGWPQFFAPAEPRDSQAQYQALLEARGAFARPVHVEQASQRLRQGEIAPRIWESLSQRCQDCGGCAYLCPTCSCFTITDQPDSATSGRRVRSWDTCTFSGFTRMAGGHNPVRREEAAIRQRFLHKLLYDVEKHGRPSCVGCGRCVGACFGGTDIVRFINLVNQDL